MTPRLLVLLLSLGLLGCAQAPEGRSGGAPAQALSVESIAGTYGPAEGIASLELGTDGSFECLVLVGMTADGCGTFEGAGVSEGRWTLRGETIAFEPRDEPDLKVSLVGATAVVAGEGILLTTGAKQIALERQPESF